MHRVSESDVLGPAFDSGIELVEIRRGMVFRRHVGRDHTITVVMNVEMMMRPQVRL